MGTINTTSTLTGLFKEQYGDSVINLAKSKARLSSRIGFKSAKLLGSKYHQPVRVALEHSITAAAANAGSVTLLAVNTGALQDAQVEGAQLIARSQVDYESIYRSANEGKASFLSATREIVQALSESAVKRLEIMTLHGQRGIGTLSAVSGSSTTRTWTISDETWSAGIWAGMAGATLDVYDSTITTKQNTTGSAGSLYINSVSIANKQLSVTGNATDLTAITSGMVLFFESHSPTTEFAGLDKITRNTGTLFNISAATYELWGGNTYSTSTGVISMGKILEAVGQTASYAADKDVIAVLSPRAFEVLNADQAALRQYDVSYKSEGKNGYQGLKFASQVGDIEIMAHPFQKDGLCHVFCPEETMRIGATDLTFIKRHGDTEALILENSTTAGGEMRAYSNQALFVEAPRHTVVMAGITY